MQSVIQPKGDLDMKILSPQCDVLKKMSVDDLKALLDKVPSAWSSKYRKEHRAITRELKNRQCGWRLHANRTTQVATNLRRIKDS
jgi:hypothetical protein